MARRVALVTLLLHTRKSHRAIARDMKASHAWISSRLRRPAVQRFMTELAMTALGVAASRSIQTLADLGAGHFTWDLIHPDRESAQVARKSELWTDVLLPALEEHCASWSALGLDTIGAGAREPGIAGGVKRTALFRLLPGVDPEVEAEFARDTLAMPAHIASIRNWRLSRAVTLEWDATDGTAWDFVWEQEYADLDGLTVDYMIHPHHWAHVDRWFDLESGAQVVHPALCHAFAGLGEGFIAR